MPAVYIPYSDNVFTFGGKGGTGLVSIPQLDKTLNSASNGGGLAMYTGMSITVNETVQYLLTFGNSIRYIDFGRGLGVATVTGIIFTDCSSTFASSSFFSTVNPLKGTLCTISMLDYSCNAILMSATAEVTAEPDTMLNFSITFNIVSDNPAAGSSASGGSANNQGPANSLAAGEAAAAATAAAVSSNLDASNNAAGDEGAANASTSFPVSGGGAPTNAA